MTLLLHDIGIPGWFFPVFLLLAIISTYFVVYGVYSLARHWQHLDRRLKIIFAAAPGWAFLIALLFGDHGLLISLPFGVFTGIPMWLVISIMFGSEHWIPEFALPYFGLLINLCGLLGLARLISKFFGYR
jgi:hypothetical protein